MGLVRGRTRWPAGLVALAGVLALAGSAPLNVRGDDAAVYAQCLRTAQETAAKYQDAQNISISVACQRADGSYIDPAQWLPAPPVKPAPTPVTTAGHPGCVTGPDRPVTDTALTTALATTDSGQALIYGYQHLGDTETINTSGSTALEFGVGDLAPGESYRWRARVDDTTDDQGVFRTPEDAEQGWSPWCEFTVAADAVDYRDLGDVSLKALDELGLRPDRDYRVSLSAAQQRLLRDGTDIGRTTARMTLTGPRWTDLLLQLTESAFLADEDLESGEDYATPERGAAYRKLVDTISTKLGGPRHPHLD